MSDLVLQTTLGQDIAPYIAELAAFRIRGFRAFPYLYEGTEVYERQYLEGYLQEPRAMLVRVLDGEQLVAIATATPLASSADVVTEAPAVFAAAGHDPRQFYYYAEIIVDPAARGRGIAPRIYAERERLARQWGYSQLCLAVVERDAAHPLRPRDYKSPERIWQRDGFVKTSLTFTYRWPTIQADGRVIDQDNPMRFWTKTL